MERAQGAAAAAEFYGVLARRAGAAGNRSRFAVLLVVALLGLLIMGLGSASLGQAAQTSGLSCTGDTGPNFDVCARLQVSATSCDPKSDYPIPGEDGCYPVGGGNSMPFSYNCPDHYQSDGAGSCTLMPSCEIGDLTPSKDGCIVPPDNEVGSNPDPTSAQREPAPRVSVAVLPTNIMAGGTATITVTLANTASGNMDLTGLGDSVALPAGVVIAAAANASNTCSSGMLSASAGDSSMTLSGATLAAGASCTFRADVTATTASIGYMIPTGAPSSTESGNGTAGTSASLAVTAALSPPTVSAAFTATSITTAQTTTLTVTISNPNNSDLTNVDGTITLPSNLAPATLQSGSGACAGGSISGQDISFSGAIITANNSCTLTMTVTPSATGNYTPTASGFSSAETGSVANPSVTGNSKTLAVTTPTSQTFNYSGQIEFGGCSLVTANEKDSKNATAWLYIIDKRTRGSAVFASGTTLYYYGKTSTDYLKTTNLPVTREVVSSCLGVSSDNVTNLTQKASPGTTFADAIAHHDEFSSSFDLAQDAGILGQGHHSYSFHVGLDDFTHVGPYAANTTVPGSYQQTVDGKTVTVTVLLAPSQATSLELPFKFGTISPILDALQLANSNSTVDFFDNGLPIPAGQGVMVVNNSASCSVTLSGNGPHLITAQYGGKPIVTTQGLSGVLVGSIVDTMVQDSTAVGSFLSDRANQIVTNLPGMDRQIDRLNAAKQAQQSQGGTGNFAAPGKDDLNDYGKGDMEPPIKSDLLLNVSRLGSGPTSASITASRLGVSSGVSVGPTSVGEQDFLGFQSFLYDYLKSAGESGNFGQFNFSGPLDMHANFGEGGGHASFKASLSQLMEWQQQREQKEMAALGFGKGSGPSNFMPLDIWTEGVYTSYSGTRSGNFGMATLGTDYVFSPNFLAGFYGQFDMMDQTTGTPVSGKGWMAGPYATVRLGENMFFQARAGWGKSANDITPSPAGTDSFASTRWLVSSALSGKWNIGQGWTFTPATSFTYFDDRSDSYINQFGIAVPGVETSLGQLKLSPELSYGFVTQDDVWVEPSLSTELIWNFASTNIDGLGSLNGDATGPAGLRGRVKVGVDLRTPSGILLGASASYDGIGASNYSAISGQATVTVPLH